MKKINGKGDNQPTNFIMIPCPVFCNGIGASASFRIVNWCYDVSFDTGEPSPSGKGNILKNFRIVGEEEYIAYEQASGKQVLTPQDKELVRKVSDLLRRMSKYYPKFERTAKGTKVDLPPLFVSHYRSLLKIQCIPNLMLFPGIFLAENIGGSSFIIHNSSTCFVIAKSKVIEDILEHISNYATNPEYASKISRCLEGPDEYMKAPYMLTLCIDKSQADKEANNQAAFDRCTSLAITEYNPVQFQSLNINPNEPAKPPFSINKEVLDKLFDLYNKENFYRVSVFDRAQYEELYNILKTAEGWVAKYISNDDKQSSIDLLPDPNLGNSEGMGVLSTNPNQVPFDTNGYAVATPLSMNSEIPQSNPLQTNPEGFQPNLIHNNQTLENPSINSLPSNTASGVGYVSGSFPQEDVPF